MILFGASLMVALVGYLVFVRPVRQEIGTLVERILAVKVNVAEMTHRLERTPSPDDEIRRRLRRQLEEALPPSGDRWDRLDAALKGVPDTNGFKALFAGWHDRMLAEGILVTGAWPRAAWRTGHPLPSLAEKESTARQMLLVEGLGRGLHEDAGARILRVTLHDTADEIEIAFQFDPILAGGLLDTILKPRLGGEIFDLLGLTIDVAESDAATGRIRLVLVDPER